MRLLSKIFNLNDPGWGRGQGGNGSEPPKRPPQGNGPPDLDQVWRDVSNRLSALFGRGNGGGSRPNPSPGMGGPTNLPASGH